jgi:Family of unknown function (DUF6515)
MGAVNLPNGETAMKKNLSRIALGAVLAVSLANVARADDRHERRERHEERHEVYRTPHVVYDDRFHHNHYYPRVGYAVTALPAGHVVVRFGGSPFYFHSGVWYRHVGPSFVVVRPPRGIVVPILPVGYSTVIVNGAPYYYANDVYYVQRADGYTVVDAPEGTAVPVSEVPPAPAAPAPAASAAAGTWYYCDASKAYYPYVQSCPGGWRPVAATPPR